jgi:hypothetical protein
MASNLPSVPVQLQDDPYRTYIWGGNNPDGIYLHRCDAKKASAVLRVKKWRTDRELGGSRPRFNRELSLLRKKKKLIVLTLQQIESGEACLRCLLRSYQRREKGIDKALLRARTRRNEFQLREARGREQSRLRPTLEIRNGMHELNGRPLWGVALNEPLHVCKSSPTTIDRLSVSKR